MPHTEPIFYTNIYMISKITHTNTVCVHKGHIILTKLPKIYQPGGFSGHCFEMVIILADFLALFFDIYIFFFYFFYF